MEIEQLVSFVRYQAGQKQGWDALDEVLTVVQEAKERVDTAGKAVVAQEAKVNKLLGEATQLEASLAAQKVSMAKQLVDLKASHQAVLDKATEDQKVVLLSIQKEVVDLGVTIKQLEVSRAQLAGEVDTLQKQKRTADAELNRIRRAITDLKDSI